MAQNYFPDSGLFEENKMELSNIITGTKFFEFINNIDDLILDLLYSPENGYVNLSSKDAIIQAENKIRYFDEYVNKIIEEAKLNNIKDIVEEKRNFLIEAIKKHYSEQTIVWCDEVYQNCIENCKTIIAINRDEKETVNKNIQKVQYITNWISDIKNLTDKEKTDLYNQFQKELDETIRSNKFENPKNKTSNEQIYLELFFKIKNKDFININLDSYTDELTKEDLNYLKQIQTNLSTYKINSIIDEIDLIESAIQISDLKTDKEKYEFIKEVLNDFILYKSENKKLAQEDKISVIKNRILKFKNSLNYFKNLIKQEKI